MNLPTKESMQKMRDAVLQRANGASLQEKALFVIDALLVETDDGNTLLDKVYRIAHGCNELSSCYEAHNDWRDEACKEFDSLIADLRATEETT